MEEGFEIPIGGNLEPLQQAFAQIAAAIEKMGASIAASLEKSNASMNKAATAMQSIGTAANSAATAANSAGSAASSAGGKFTMAAKAAIALGTAGARVSEGLGHMASIMTALSGNNFGTMLTNLTRIGSGFKSAISASWRALQQLGTSNSLLKIAAGAAAAAAGVLVIRQAFRTVTGSIRLAKNTIAGIFSGIAAGARAAAAATAAAFSKVASIPKSIASSLSKALPVAGLIGGLGGIAGAVGLAVKAIDKAADKETLETAFAPILGGAAAAKARIAELSKFAADTPFEMPEVASASRVLEVLTKGALSTGAGLRMVGDVAAGTNEPIAELATWIGRLYDGLQSGRPVGEALMRLQELGIVSGDVRSKLEALQESGASGAETWKVAEAALGRFSGAMERQSRTWNGKLSTMRDSIGMVLAAFGEPIIDALKPFLDMAIARIDSMKAAASELGAKIKTAMNIAVAAWETGNFAELIGAGLQLAVIDGVNEFSSGIQKTVAFLAAAMSEIMSSLQNSTFVEQLVGIFENLARGMGNIIATAILRAVDQIPGIDTTYAGDVFQKGAEKRFNQAREGAQNFDSASAVQASIDATRRAIEKGMAAANSAGSSPILNREKAAAKVEEVLKKLEGVLAEQGALIAEDNRKFDERLKNSTPGVPGGTENLQSSVNRAAAPAVMSLTRVGGGGFGQTVLTSLVTEAKRQTGLLKTLVDQGKSKPSNVARFA